MQCHYDVLAIPRDAIDGDIKKSYRKLALKLHPDKNPDNIEECTKKFHLVQQAYEVLIDPQERAWYDKHREAILRGGLGHGDNYQDSSLDVYQYFNTACYSGFGDDENGFFAVYREVFKKITTEDEEYNDDSDWESPEFGDSQSSYEDVVGPFYGYWESYCTLKSYVWVEKYDTREAPHRQVRRAMEQENKKLRDKARKERNEEVKALVAFVRKRDKRVQVHKKKLEERATEIAERTQAKKEKDRQERLKAMEDYKEVEWSAMSELENELEKLEANYDDEYGEGYDDSAEEEMNNEGAEVNGDATTSATCEEVKEDEEEEPYYDDMYCVACNRAFKTDKAYINHEKSKKHRENIAALKAEMKAEEGALQEQEDPGDAGLDSLSEDEVLEQPKQKLSKKQKKKKKRQQILDQVETNENQEETTADTSTEQDNSVTVSAVLQECDGRVVEETKEDASSVCTEETDSNIKDTVNVEMNDASSLQEGATSNTPVTKLPSKAKKSDEAKGPPQFCHVCNYQFSSRNKLFGHIKKTGHALRVSEPVDFCVAEEIKKQGKKKKKGGKK